MPELWLRDVFPVGVVWPVPGLQMKVRVWSETKQSIFDAVIYRIMRDSDSSGRPTCCLFAESVDEPGTCYVKGLDKWGKTMWPVRVG